MMKRLVVSFWIGVVAMVVTVYTVPGLHVHWQAFDFIGLAVLYGVVNALLGTVLRLITLPARILTLGLISIVVNGIVLVVTAGISDTLAIDRFLAACAGALVLGIIDAIGHIVAKTATKSA